MVAIHEAVRAGRPVNAKSLAQQLDVERKTIIRDVKFMRKNLGLPLRYDRRRKVYWYEGYVGPFPTMKVTEGDLVTLLVARKAVAQYQGTSFYQQLAASFEKIAAALPEKVSLNAVSQLEAISFNTFGAGRENIDVFNAVSRAVLRERELKLQYRKPGETKPTRRHLQPYHLTHRENMWYLIASDHGMMKTFALPRITQPQVLAKRFKRSRDFSIEKFFAGALGV
jgi:predicted DNA-binding transcriptional regulator YafY